MQTLGSTVPDRLPCSPISPQSSRHLAQRGQATKGRSIIEARHNALITTDGCHTQKISCCEGMGGLLKEGEVGSFLWIQNCVCALWAVASIFSLGSLHHEAACSSSLKLIWRSAMRGRNMEAHRRRDDAEHVGVHTEPLAGVKCCSGHRLCWRKSTNRSSVTSWLCAEHVCKS